MQATVSLTMALKSISRPGPKGFFSWKFVSFILLPLFCRMFFFSFLLVLWNFRTMYFDHIHRPPPTCAKYTPLPDPTNFVSSFSLNPQSPMCATLTLSDVCSSTEHGVTLLKKADSSSSYELPITPISGRDFVSGSSLHAAVLAGWCLPGFWTCYPNHCEFPCAPALLCPENIVSL